MKLGTGDRNKTHEQVSATNVDFLRAQIWNMERSAYLLWNFSDVATVGESVRLHGTPGSTVTAASSIRRDSMSIAGI